jgi:hypothetical protein
MTLHPIPLNFLIYEENFLFFFISVEQQMTALLTKKQFRVFSVSQEECLGLEPSFFILVKWNIYICKKEGHQGM